MLSFTNDYCECAHEKVLEKMMEVRLEKNPGYGTDDYCKRAEALIKKACGSEDSEVYFLVGGTQTNQIIIDTVCRPWEGVVAAETAHVNTHEAGAIEYSGHKVMTVPEHDGKASAEDVDRLCRLFYADDNHEHEVYPGMVYISHPTELGTLYTVDELKKLREVCDRYQMKLYLDGARLGTALACPESDVTLKDIAELTDMFYIGGTKCGALFGEAVVFNRGSMPERFNTRVKQHGGMLAKGWLLGLQFEVLFTDDLYLECGKNAIKTAEALRKILAEKGYEFFVENPTNQIMVTVENSKMEELKKHVNFSFWDTVDENHTAIRFCTSWGTKVSDVEALRKVL